MTTTTTCGCPAYTGIGRMGCDTCGHDSTEHEAHDGPCTHRQPATDQEGLLSTPADQDDAAEDLVSVKVEVPLLRARLKRAEAERDQLRRWKAEAVPVILGQQDLGRALGIPMGASITGQQAADAAAALVAERDELRATITSGQVWYSPGYTSPINGTVCPFGNTTVDPEFTAREVADLTTKGEPGDADLFVASRLVMPWKRAALDGAGEQR